MNEAELVPLGTGKHDMCLTRILSDVDVSRTDAHKVSQIVTSGTFVSRACHLSARTDQGYP
jgi:hypothetical protein